MSDSDYSLSSHYESKFPGVNEDPRNRTILTVEFYFIVCICCLFLLIFICGKEVVGKTNVNKNEGMFRSFEELKETRSAGAGDKGLKLESADAIKETPESATVETKTGENQESPESPQVTPVEKEVVEVSNVLTNTPPENENFTTVPVQANFSADFHDPSENTGETFKINEGTIWLRLRYLLHEQEYNKVCHQLIKPVETVMCDDLKNTLKNMCNFIVSKDPMGTVNFEIENDREIFKKLVMLWINDFLKLRNGEKDEIETNHFDFVGGCPKNITYFHALSKICHEYDKDDFLYEVKKFVKKAVNQILLIVNGNEQSCSEEVLQFEGDNVLCRS